MHGPVTFVRMALFRVSLVALYAIAAWLNAGGWLMGTPATVAGQVATWLALLAWPGYGAASGFADQSLGRKAWFFPVVFWMLVVVAVGVGWLTLFMLPPASLVDGGLVGGLLYFIGTAPFYGLTAPFPAVHGSPAAVIGVSAGVLLSTLAANRLAGGARLAAPPVS